MGALIACVCAVILWAIVHDVCRAVVDCRRAMFGKCCCCDPEEESIDVDLEDSDV